MSLIQAIIMGLIQGLTEFLPVSSSGHLALFRSLFQIETDTGILFDVLLHMGTLISIFFVYFRDIARLITDGIGILRDVCINIGIFVKNLRADSLGKKSYLKVINSSYRKFAMLVIVSTIPTGIIGFVGKDVVETASSFLIIPGICLIVTAGLLFFADRISEGAKLPKNTTYTDAFHIGIAQGIATLPGLSRSGTTVTACLFCGLNRSFAVKYSFIMSIPAVFGAVVLEIGDIAGADITGTEIAYYVVGMVVAAAVGYVCIKTMLYIVRQKKFTIFAAYCLIIGLISVGAYFII